MQSTQASLLRSVFTLQDECTVIAKELKKCLEEERSALIRLETATILHTNAKKENLSRLLISKKKMGCLTPVESA